MTLPFIDLQSQRLRIGAEIDAALLEVARSGQYIMGPAVAALERALREFGQAPGAEAAERSGPLLTHGGQLVSTRAVQRTPSAGPGIEPS
ncbi:hypothetical protein [Brevundimonas naejangsanensis]|uniref:hypothetical protein n=1 Tax=Brevundimonas naejangsanensis TaxID=588932 RepID=UPI0026EBB372|nr:hypothetical protein [Brevundimonas naejangsanensis]